MNDDGQQSFMMVMLYLNTPRRGGETNFLNPRNEDDVASVIPAPGLALVFDHRLLHEGARLHAGTKYAIRTDVMFERVKDDQHPAMRLTGSSGAHHYPSGCELHRIQNR